MKLIIPALGGLLFLPAGDLTIDYSTGRTLEISIETEVSSENTHFSLEVDGEPMDRGFAGGGGSEFRREVVYSDTVLEHDGGAPTKVKRSFETISAARTIARGEETMNMELETPSEGMVLIITLEDGEAVSALETGSNPERKEMLEGHQLTNLLAGLLPADDSAADSSPTDWEPEQGLTAALLLDVEKALFPPGQSEAGDEHGGRGRRGPGPGSALGFLKDAEWDAKATRTDAVEDIDGVECIVIELEFEADGDLPERRRGRGRDHKLDANRAGERLLESTYSIEFEGKLYFSVEQQRPVKLELEGEYVQETLTERDTPQGSMRIERTLEGTIEHTVTITSEDD
jgi:hypothetical protein